MKIDKKILKKKVIIFDMASTIGGFWTKRTPQEVDNIQSRWDARKQKRILSDNLEVATHEKKTRRM